MRLGCRKHNGKRFTSLQLKCHIRFGLNPKKGEVLSWVWNRERTEKLVNGKQYSVWFVPTGMKGLPQNVLLNFRLEFPKSELTIYLPSGMSNGTHPMCRALLRHLLSPPSHFSIFELGGGWRSCAVVCILKLHSEREIRIFFAFLRSRILWVCVIDSILKL